MRRYGYGEWLLQQISQHVRNLKQQVLQAVTQGSTAGGNDAVDSIMEFEDLISKALAEGPPAAPAQLPGRPGFARSSYRSSTGAVQHQQPQPQFQQHHHYGTAISNGQSHASGDGSTMSVSAGTAHRANGFTAAANGRTGYEQAGAAVAGGRSVLDDAADTQQQLACIICLDAPRSVLLLPCKHLVLCSKCADELTEKAMTSREWRSVVRAQPVCPVCREVVTSHIQGVYL